MDGSSATKRGGGFDIADGVRSFARADAQSQRVLATVLFTDIVDSTRLATEMGDRRWRDLLQEHQKVVRGHLERFGGREVKTTGDGFLAVFDGPTRAVECARAIADDMPALGIQVRAGIHTGEVELIGDDVGGIAVHVAARVMALAGPGRVVLGGTGTHQRNQGLAFVDAGVHELKGVSGARQLFRLAEPDS